LPIVVADPLLSTLRISILTIFMAVAARSDFDTLSVRDRHWIRWSAPVVLILLVEMASENMGLANFCMIFSLVAVFSFCFSDPPDPRDFRDWNQNQAFLSVVYALGLVGFLYGADAYSDTNFVDLVLGDESKETTLWWSMNGAFLTSAIFYGSWRIGLIQGGADVKALILITLVFPSWSFVPDQMYPLVEDPLFRMPPSMVLFMWAAAAFLVAPPIIFIQNAARGNISSPSDLKMAWHATKRRISDIKETSDSTSYQSWILTEAIEKNGEMSAVDRILPSRRLSNAQDDEKQLELLEELGLESVWITTKHPFLVYLFLAILPMLLLGDPLSYLIR
tara:strand:+ start:617 stop:1621 length:1005 start_codon:yes stop_codon:yes gene_type:complete